MFFVVAMKTAAVVVNWNQPQFTRQCVESLLRGHVVPDVVLVVDNGSIADPRPILDGIGGCIQWVLLPENRGFAAGANAGMRRALALGAETVFLINNDAVADPRCLAELAAALERQKLAAAGAKTLTRENPPRIHTAYGVLTYHGPLVQQRGWMEPDTSRFSEFAEVDYVSGCAVLLCRCALEQVGLFDEAFFAYHEDLDWCVRARRAGYKVAYVPTAVVYHWMHASTGGGYTSPITYLSARNAILFVRKNAPVHLQAKYATHLAVNLIKDGVFRWRRRELQGFRLRLRGLWDGLLQRPVPVEELRLASRATWHEPHEDRSDA